MKRNDTNNSGGKGRPQLLQSLSRVAKVLQAESDPGQALLQLANIVKEHMDADGAKVLVVQRGILAPELSTLCRTDIQNLDEGARSVQLSKEKGLAAWVIWNHDWLLIPDIPEQRPKTSPRLKAWTGNHDEVEIYALLEKELVESKEDEEFTLLMVPLHSGGQPAGVLGVWRDEKRPFAAPQDPAELEKIAPYVAATCRQVLQYKALEAELEAISTLAEALQGAKSLADAYGAVAAGVGRLSAAPHAVLLHHDPDRPGNLYQRFTWSNAGDEVAGGVQELFKGLHIHCGPGESWKHGVEVTIRKILSSGGEGKNLVVRPERILGLSQNGEGFPRLAVVLLDQRSEASEAAFFDDDLRGHAAFSFLHYAGSMLDSHVEKYPRRILEDISGQREESLDSVQNVMEQAARVLLEATSSSGALVYGGFEGSMSVTSTSPPVRSLIGLDVTNPSLTLQSIEKKEILRVVDTGDSEDRRREELDRDRLERIRAAFGWDRIRSWLACPLIDQERCIGVIKLLTAGKDTFLGNDHELLAKAVAQRAAWEIHKLNRRLMLEELNQMANRLTEESGKPLGEELIRELDAWVGRFIRPGASVAVISRILPDKPLVNQGSSGVSAELIEKLQTLSRQWGHEPREWDRRDTFDGSSSRRISLDMAGCAVPIRLPKRTFLEGHFVLLHRSKRFVQAEVEAAREAARELGLILNTERLRRQWVEGVGRFRHAVLGPVQGLTSRARALALLCEERKAGGDQVQKLKAEIEEEAEVVRLWRYNQRLYLSDSVEVRKRRNSLKKVFDRCVDRYRPILQARNVKIRGEWPRQGGELQFWFDDKALDLALSNLLDNARKYSFYNTMVVVGVTSDRDTIRIWVEDKGHPIPKRLRELIYLKEYRMDWQDPFRTIGGEGLGLPMVQAIVDAHDGELKHECEPMSGTADSKTRPYLVRFTIELPTYWGR